MFRLSRVPRELQHVRDLEAFDGAILSEYRTDGGASYLEKWCARQGRTVTTLLVRTEHRAVAEYLAGRLSMLRLLTEPSDGVGFLVERTSGQTTSVHLASLSELPEAYLPKPTAMHDLTLRPAWDTIPQNFLLGRFWDAEMLATIERHYRNVYSFSFHTEPNTGRSFPNIMFAYQYDGGFPLMHAFNAMRGAVPLSARPRSAAVVAGSPGVLTIDAPRETVAHLMRTFAALEASSDAYTSVHQWSRQKWTRSEPSIPSGAEGELRRLCDHLLVNASALLRPADTDKHAILLAGKLVASYYRRLWDVLRPDDEVEFLDAPALDRAKVPADQSFSDDEEGDPL